MSDPHGWGAQKAQIIANQQAAQQRQQEFLHAGAARHHERTDQGQQPPWQPPPLPQPKVKSGSFWAVVAFCPTHQKWGCSYKRADSKRAFYEAYSAASGHGQTWCHDLMEIHETAGELLSPGYLMVSQTPSGDRWWRTGRSRRWMAWRLRRKLGRDAEPVLVVSVRRGVLVNKSLDLKIGWTDEDSASAAAS